mgnify:CR=1 FL=1
MIRAKKILLLFISAFVIITVACEHQSPLIADESQTLDGPVDGLTSDEILNHLQGDDIFNGRTFTSSNGLGPIFVAQSCNSCHRGDGKSHPFVTVTRFGQTDETGNKFLVQGGPEIQSKALPGFMPEELPSGATFTRLIAPITAGVGFLEAVPDSLILSMADPNDLDHDGISGVPNWKALPAFIIPNSDAISQDGKYICKIGKKASVYNVFEQVVFALNEDIGITSEYAPIDPHTLQVSEPEITNDDISAIAFYLRTLKAPSPRLEENKNIKNGHSVFIAVGCEGCHKETLKTGKAFCEVMSYKEFHPYTDLLLHDMGPGLDDGYTEGSAKTYEWRTPPLWGLGLAPQSQGGSYYLLHDGRAHSIEQAILMHGGEAEGRIENFKKLTQQDKYDLLKFLQSL